MIGLGTIVNTAAIVAGGICGLLFRRFLQERFQETITRAMGFAILVMSLGGTLSQMLVVNLTGSGGQLTASLDTQGTVMMVISLAAGGLVGELLNLELWLQRFGTWLRDRTGSQGDGQFISAFVSASLTVCVGAMAIIGSIQDGISGSAIPVALVQGAVTLLANEAAPLMTEAALSNISLVGNVLILCVGVNLIRPQTIRVANVLPAVVIAAAFAAL